MSTRSLPEPIPTLERVVNVGGVAQLLVVGGCGEGRRFKIEGAATLGRSPDAAVMLEDPEVSRLHARLNPVRGGFEIEDLRSRNGTFVNGTRVERVELAVMDKIRLGPNSVLEFQSIDVVEDSIVQRQRFEAIGRLGVGVAHDMKNALAALDAGVVFLADLPMDRPMGDPDTRECIADLALALTRASQLARDLLSFARARGTDRGPVDLSSLVREVVRMLRHTLDPAIRIELFTPPELYVHGSKSELHQVLINLCLNARDAMPKGGVLVVRGGVLSPGDGGAGGIERSVAQLSVADTGTGMDQDTRDRIFTQFFSTKREGIGYGLGLYTAREVIKQHAGRILVESAPGLGSKFTIELPLIELDGTPLSSTGERVPARVPERPVFTRNVLLVDDEPLVRRSMGRLLRRAGFEVTEVGSGEDALIAYGRAAYDLVLLDFNMPTMNGEETLQRLRSMDPEVRVVFATGHGDTTLEASLKARGALGVLEKPYSLEALFDLLRQRPDFEPPTRS